MPFAVTRLVILVLLLLPSFIRVIPELPEGVHAVAVVKAPILRSLREAVRGGDSLYYLEIAKEGYHGELSRNFPPGYPMAVAVVAAVTGEYWLTATFLSSLLMCAGLVALYRTSLAIGLTEDDADRAVLLCCVFPGTHFMSLPFAESLLFMSSTWAIYCAFSQRWWLAGVCGICASIAKIPGSLVILPMAVFYYQQYRFSLRRELVPILAVPFGLLGYWGYLYSRASLDFHEIQRRFGHAGVSFFLAPIWAYVKHPGAFSVWQIYPLHFS